MSRMILANGVSVGSLRSSAVAKTRTAINNATAMLPTSTQPIAGWRNEPPMPTPAADVPPIQRIVDTLNALCVLRRARRVLPDRAAMAKGTSNGQALPAGSIEPNDVNDK
jgi:hypothetical protein